MLRKILDKLIMVKWCNGVTKYASTFVWCYGKTNMLQWCREYTQVHMVKWRNKVMKWFNNIDLHLIMVKWCNKYGEMVQRIHTSSHGEMVKHTSGDILFEKWKNWYTHLRRPSLWRASWLHQLPHLPSSLWEVPCWWSPMSRSNALQCRIPPLLLIDTFLIYLPSATTNTGGVRTLL